MDDTDLQQAVQEDLQWEPRVDAAHAAPSAGFLGIVVGYDGSAPASRALDAAVRSGARRMPLIAWSVRSPSAWPAIHRFPS